MPARIRDALGLLLQAHQYAQELARDCWDFAVEITSLRAVGLSNSDLRWLVCKACVEHAVETTPFGRGRRSFQASRELSFGERTCFVLTRAGVQSALRLLAEPPIAGKGQPRPRPAHLGADLTPTWNKDRRELRVGSDLVKQFKQPAPNQEIIISAFEEEGWPDVIDDPLPPRAQQDAKRRLHDTINNLNRNQKRPLLRFSGNGCGQGVRWRLLPYRARGRRPATPELR
jgi:hypothetical protein